MTLRRRLVFPCAAMLMAAAVGSCRDSTGPPAGAEHPGRFPTGQVTFSVAADRSPTWSPDGDSLYYVTEGDGPFPGGPGLLVALSLRTNVSTPLRPDVQVEEGLSIRARDPRASPDGSELVFVELLTLHPPQLCRLGSLIYCEQDVDPVVPPIAGVRLRIRDRDLTPGRPDQARTELRIQGPDLEAEFPRGSTAVYETRYFPFQQEFLRDRSVPFGPSWSPEGRRLVVSDGLRLYVWDRSSEGVERLVGGEGGMRPDWSPEGDRIAFTMEVRGDSIQVYCMHQSPVEPDFTVCHQYRWLYMDVRRHVALLPAQGGEARVLWEGRNPTWHPDGRRLVFVGENRLWLGAAEGGDPVPIPDTEGALEPSVSPDGTRIAFVRRVGLTYDIWVIPFPEG